MNSSESSDSSAGVEADRPELIEPWEAAVEALFEQGFTELGRLHPERRVLVARRFADRLRTVQSVASDGKATSPDPNCHTS